MKICLDAGHGGNKPGAVFNLVHEADIVLLVALCLEKYLIKEGHEIIQTRSFRDEAVSLSRRVAIANNANADCFISLHCNADPDDDVPGQPEAKGEEIWIYKGSKGGRKLAEALKIGVDRIFPQHKFRGIKESKRLYVLRKTKMPAVLIELGFIDNRIESGALSKPDMYSIIAKHLNAAFKGYLK